MRKRKLDRRAVEQTFVWNKIKLKIKEQLYISNVKSNESKIEETKKYGIDNSLNSN